MKKLNLSALSNNNWDKDNNIELNDNSQLNTNNDLIKIKSSDTLKVPTKINNPSILPKSKKLTLKDLNIKVEESKDLNEDIILQEKKDDEVILDVEKDSVIDNQVNWKTSLFLSINNKKEEIEKEKLDNSNLIKTQELKIQDSETNLKLQTEITNEIFSNYVPSTKKVEEVEKQNSTKQEKIVSVENIKIEENTQIKAEIIKKDKKSIDLKPFLLKTRNILNKYKNELFLKIENFKINIKSFFNKNKNISNKNSSNLKLKITKIIEKTKNKKIYIPVSLWFIWIFSIWIFLFQANSINSNQIKSNVQENQQISTWIINNEINNNNVNINKVNTIDNNTKSHKINKELKEFLIKNQK